MIKRIFKVIGSPDQFEEHLKYVEKVSKLVYTGKLDWLTSSSPNYRGPQGDLEFVLDLAHEKDSVEISPLRIYPIRGDIRIKAGEPNVKTPYKLESTNAKSTTFDCGGIAVKFFYHPKKKLGDEYK